MKPDDSGMYEMLAEYRRVGIVTPEDWAQARPRVRPIGPLRRMMPPDIVGILRQLPDGAGPTAVRDFTEVAIAEFHGFPVRDTDA